MAGMTDYLEAALLDHVFKGVTYTPPTTIYLAFFTTTPTDAGDDGVEVVGGSYARQPITWGTVVSPGGTVDNSAAVDFTNLPACTVTGVALMDDVTGGNALMVRALSPSVTYTAGENVNVPIGDVIAAFG